MYNKRIVAFIDLLGFSDLVINDSFQKVNEVLKAFTEMLKSADQTNTQMVAHSHIAANKYDKEMIEMSANKQNITFFSDCVVWSYPLDEIKVDFIHVMSSLCSSFLILQNVLYSKGILIRGGVSYGNLYQSNNKVFGEGLINAYRIEQITRYPRIAFDNSFLSLINKDHMRLIDKEITFSPKGFFFLDIFKYTNSLNQLVINSESQHGVAIKEMVLKSQVDWLCFAIKSGKQFTHPKIREKYDWMECKLRSIKNLQVPLTGLDPLT